MRTLSTVVLAIGLGVASALPVAGQVDYVGTKALASYLVTTPNGLILINSDLEPNVPQIKASIEHLGFKFSDVKILLISHAHFDHDAGSARIKALTGAKYIVMHADVPVSAR
jgi:metallo-beta-lactamase class B